MWRASGARFRVPTGTRIAPASAIPQCATSQSTPLGSQTPTRSPGATPCAARASANRPAASRSSPYVIRSVGVAIAGVAACCAQAASKTDVSLISAAESRRGELAGADAGEEPAHVVLELAVEDHALRVFAHEVVDAARSSELRRVAQIGRLAQREEVQRRHL